MRRAPKPSAAVLVYPVVGALATVLAVKTGAPSVLTIASAAAFLTTVAWLLISERYEHTLVALMIYLGAVDGYVKLKTGSQFATLGRDVLLYAIVIGVIGRGIVRRQRMHVPPLGAWVIFFVGLAVAQMFNPGTGPMSRWLLAARPDLEFVPLFFFGYWIMRSGQRLRVFLLVLLGVCAANGLASTLQFEETPAQFAAWGPGYAQKINGTGNVTGRVFVDASGHTRVRPFGLQSDAGGGGNTGMLGLPAVVALLGPLRRRRRWKETAFVVAAGVCTILAVATSEGRGAVLASVAALIAYIGLTVVSRKMLLPALGGLLTAVVASAVVMSLIVSPSTKGAFSRYSTITPSNLVATESTSRGFALSDVPKYIGRFPFGLGLGTAGAAAGVGRQATQGVEAETEFTYLLLDLGVLGLVFIISFHGRLLALAVRRIRRVAEKETRAALAATAAPLFGIFALYFGGPTTNGSPAGPYLWFAAGVMSYWLCGVRAVRRRSAATGPPGEVARQHPLVTL